MIVSSKTEHKGIAYAVSFLYAEEADVWTILPCFMGTVSSG